MSKTPQITLTRLRELIKEEVDAKKATKLVNEQVDHASIRDVVTVASKLLASVEVFKEKASPAAMNAVTPHITNLEKVLEDMVSTPGSYVLKPKAEPKKVSLRAVKEEGVLKKHLIEAIRHGQKIQIRGLTLVLDTKSDSEWNVLKTLDGYAVARQAKKSTGHYFKQGTNPDYKGFDAYSLEYKNPNDETWQIYNSSARKGELLDPIFLNRIVSSYGPKTG